MSGVAAAQNQGICQIKIAPQIAKNSGASRSPKPFSTTELNDQLTQIATEERPGLKSKRAVNYLAGFDLGMERSDRTTRLCSVFVTSNDTPAGIEKSCTIIALAKPDLILARFWPLLNKWPLVQSAAFNKMGSEQSFAADLMKVRCKPDNVGSLNNSTQPQWNALTLRTLQCFRVLSGIIVDPVMPKL